MSTRCIIGILVFTLGCGDFAIPPTPQQVLRAHGNPPCATDTIATQADFDLVCRLTEAWYNEPLDVTLAPSDLPVRLGFDDRENTEPILFEGVLAVDTDMTQRLNPPLNVVMPALTVVRHLPVRGETTALRTEFEFPEAVQVAGYNVLSVSEKLQRLTSPDRMRREPDPERSYNIRMVFATEAECGPYTFGAGDDVDFHDLGRCSMQGMGPVAPWSCDDRVFAPFRFITFHWHRNNEPCNMVSGFLHEVWQVDVGLTSPLHVIHNNQGVSFHDRAEVPQNAVVPFINFMLADSQPDFGDLRCCRESDTVCDSSNHSFRNVYRLAEDDTPAFLECRLRETGVTSEGQPCEALSTVQLFSDGTSRCV